MCSDLGTRVYGDCALLCSDLGTRVYKDCTLLRSVLGTRVYGNCASLCSVLGTRVYEDIFFISSNVLGAKVYREYSLLYLLGAVEITVIIL